MAQNKRSAGCKRGNHSKTRKLHQTAAARGTSALERAQIKLIEDKEELAVAKQALARREAEVDAKAKKLIEWEAKRAAAEAAALVAMEAKEAARVAKAERKEEDRIARALGTYKRTSPLTLPTVHQVDEEIEKLKHAQGSVLTKQQSRCILLLFFALVRDGLNVKQATDKVANTLRIGSNKVDQVRKEWRDGNNLRETTGAGRGAVRGETDGRLAFTPVQTVQLYVFINDMHEDGKQVFRRDVQKWIQDNCQSEMSIRAVGNVLHRLGYRRRRGRIKIPPFNEERLARIRRFLVEMDRAIKEENEGNAVIVYMDESFVHQAHGSAYSYFFKDEEGVVHDGFGRTAGKGLRLIMVHAITKWGPLVTRVEPDKSDESDGNDDRESTCKSSGKEGFPIGEGYFKVKEKGRGIQGGDHFKMGDVPTAEFLWQAKLAKGDYHAAMTDTMFMYWLKYRLTPAFEAKFGKDMKMILVLDNASYHHGFDPEVKIPETNSKKYNTDLLRKNGVGHITVTRSVDDGMGGKKDCEFNFEVPATGIEFPQARSKDGVSRAEVAKATRAWYEKNDPIKLVERVEAFMQGIGWDLIWTPPYMPSFQPIELFWQHGNHYVSLNYKRKRTMGEVHEQVRLGWYGDPTWDGQEGGWRAADCRKLVAHAIREMNAWIKDKENVLTGTIGALVVPPSYEIDEDRDGIVDDEGVGAELVLDGQDGGEGEDQGGDNEEVFI